MSARVLKVRDIHVDFGGIKAADGVSLDVFDGEFLAVIGPNGSGKTTLLNICTGYVRPASGEIHLHDREITKLSPRDIAHLGVARAFQIPQLFSDQTVIDNIMLALAAKKGFWTGTRPLASESRRAEAESLLGLFGLEQDKDRVSNTLPEGHRKLLDIAIALAQKPRLLLLDEPTSGVSALERFQIMEALMAVLRKQNVTALFVEHDMDVVARYADRVLVWNSGKIMAEGSPDQVFSDARVLESVVGVARC